MLIPVLAQGFFFFFAKMREIEMKKPNVQIWVRQTRDGELSNLGIFPIQTKN